MSDLTHFDDSGASRMVDVSGKEITHRLARAEGCVVMRPETLSRITNREISKGDVLEVSRLAGIMATKRTSDLIPLCHALGLDGATVDFAAFDAGTLRIEACVRVQGRTGVEMEALTAVSIAALTVYDMCKSVDKGMTITGIRLLEKTGGRSGTWTAEPDQAPG